MEKGSSTGMSIGNRRRTSFLLSLVGVKLLNEGKVGSIKFLDPDNFMRIPSFVKKLMSENGAIRKTNRARINVVRKVKNKFKMQIRKKKIS